jgi:hypothetical protein
LSSQKKFQLVETKFLKITFYSLNNILSFATSVGEKSLVPFGILGFDAIVEI